MKKLLLACLCALLPAAGAAFGDFHSFNRQGTAQPDMDFCRKGKVILVRGYCGGRKPKSVSRISEKGCDDVLNQLPDAVKALYPSAEVELYRDMKPDDVAGALALKNVLGFVFAGAGNARGGFLLDAKTAFYPDPELCPRAKVDFFGGFYSFSKYSPDNAAPAALRKNVLSRFELNTAAKYLSGSWPKDCNTNFAGVYATPTLAGRLQNDTRQFLQVLTEAKARQVQKAFIPLCGQCATLDAQNSRLARLICAPWSSACQDGILPAQAKPLVEQSYCKLLFGE
ncbi:MAG: hypothetical protein PHP45_10775 [Elusimicrobiales bacterium]|nr:hypothetical protein [Elusimicrobiales bacterium]